MTRTSGFTASPSLAARRRVEPKWAGRMVARELRRASPATTSTREARTCASSGSRRATSRTSRFTARVMLGCACTTSEHIGPRAADKHRPRGRMAFTGALKGPRRASSMALVPLALALSFTVALMAAGWARTQRRERRLQGELNGLAERLRELSARLDAAEADVGHAITQAEITETLLLEKGLADEEDLEAARRRFDGDEPGASSGRYQPGRDGGLH